jgi:hypothetical protein
MTAWERYDRGRIVAWHHSWHDWSDHWFWARRYKQHNVKHLVRHWPDARVGG